MQTKSLTTNVDEQEEMLSVSGNSIIVKIGGDLTGDAYSVFELSVPPNTGAGLH